MISASVLIGGILGATLRLIIHKSFDYYVRYYYITIIINCVACFILGAVYDGYFLSIPINKSIALCIISASGTTSTLSAYVMDVYTYIVKKHYFTALIIFLLSHVFGFLFFYFGTLF